MTGTAQLCYTPAQSVGNSCNADDTGVSQTCSDSKGGLCWAPATIGSTACDDVCSDHGGACGWCGQNGKSGACFCAGDPLTNDTSNCVNKDKQLAEDCRDISKTGTHVKCETDKTKRCYVGDIAVGTDDCSEKCKPYGKACGYCGSKVGACICTGTDYEGGPSPSPDAPFTPGPPPQSKQNNMWMWIGGGVILVVLVLVMMRSQQPGMAQMANRPMVARGV